MTSLFAGNKARAYDPSMVKAPKNLVIKKLPRSRMKGAMLSPAARKAIVEKARASSTLKAVGKLRREDTATGSGHVALSAKYRVA